MKLRRIATLQNRVTLYFVLLALVLLILPGLFFYSTSRTYLIMQLERRITMLANIASSQFEASTVVRLRPGDEDKQLYQVLQNRLRRLGASAGVEEIYIFDLENRSLVNPSDTPSIGQEYHIVKQDASEIANVILEGAPQPSHLYRGQGGQYYMASYAPLKDASGQTVAILRVEGSPLINEVLTTYQERMLIFAALALLITLAFGRILSGYVLGPVGQLVQGVRRLSAREYQPVTIHRQDELGYLAEQFNQMAETIRDNEEELTRLHRQAAERAQELEVYNRKILESIRNGIMACQLDGRVTVINRCLKDMLGMDISTELEGRYYTDVLAANPELVAAIEESLKYHINLSSKDMRLKKETAAKPGFFDVFTSLLPGEGDELLGVIVMVVDRTQFKELQEEIEVKTRLAALGQLAAGVAHEVGNPLMGISGFVDLLQRKLAPDSDAFRLSQKVQQNIRILERVVNDFRAFSRPRPLQLQRTDVGQLCATAVSLIEPYGREKEVTIVLGGRRDVLLNIDADLIQQCVLNIIRNAVDASMPGGEVTVSWSEEGMFGRIAVEDRGRGMPPSVKASIFEPFFTTKDVGEGTGLGLAITHTIVEKHHGYIRVESEEDTGTTVALMLPLVPVADELTG